ncbi:winged helix-turn-helix transcriptional regulator [Amycolatopsis sp. K13G38]|uniref:Winged helix-turn-helix transcriptional regulator n=1 Tax=Amycolatopsis acididurans TaxID=2724524 RepID=A0ABX1J911_9PSEU|nr:winged helix-turn-helix domain-containing protein [Amycolatopsis acididurans]NKQ55374.1 winged helix-turn-helix transcriptional regulator [Amycolatopsis acididurans]
MSAACFDPDPARYVYDELARHLAGRIEAGEFQANTRLPSEQQLAEQYGVSLGTARHATQLLREAGLVITVPAKGTYVTGRRPDTASE